MIIDSQTLFSGTIAADGTRTGQPITATAISANVLDRAGNLPLFPVLSDEGLSEGDVFLVVVANAAANGADAAKTLTITLESDTAPGLATAPVVHFSSGPILGSAITAGAQLVRLLIPSADYKRYLGLRYTVSASFTSFPLTAFIAYEAIQRNVIYPTNFTIDV